MLVSGGAGVGKSRLVSEVARHASEEHDAKVLTGRCVPYGEDVWWPIAETIRAVCDIPANASHELARARIFDEVAEATGRDVEAPEVARVGRGLLYLLGYADELGDVDPSRARDDALRSGQALFGHIASRVPTVLVLSDLHWADRVVLDLIDRLLGALRATPFVLLATARPDLEERWRPRGRASQPERAEPRAARPGGGGDPRRRAARGRTRRPSSPRCCTSAAGATRSSSRSWPRSIRDPEPAALTSGRLPATLQGLVTARLDGLGPDERDVIADCAVIGATGRSTCSAP